MTLSRLFTVFMALMLLGACSTGDQLPQAKLGQVDIEAPLYRIGPGDGLQIFVWRNPDLTRNVTVRPDGRITIPLINDLKANGKTPTALARDIEKELATYIQDPLVTVIVNSFSGTFQQQVRVVGAATQPQAIPYRANMTLLDVMIRVGGLTEFAAGDRAKLIRVVDGEQKEFSVELDSLVRDGEISENVAMRPGDVLIIPETFL
ncbi:sugar ABC transporter substrate-binding protein [Rhodovibrio sodomensis]|uniref:Sugar ABC transporter substrate-binding protein n=1 Tax=Rhodovibrio sodomensis TaxID=1088 RepID=A0ABS1DKB7_9PROT|nr:XrtA/PEP-CTERM system exopolysaccharide export protein [Rhodovibrio sodomensis]MBK1670163.1 sugar ABC transporter substrate-binding protein [Rhodovibrio sodomensis]